MFSFSSFVFPRPEPANYDLQTFENEKYMNLIFVPQQEAPGLLDALTQSCITQGRDKSHIRKIPCLYLKYELQEDEIPSDEIILYFHGNAEDIGYARYFLLKMQDFLCRDIIVMEYPGYGVYLNHQPSSELIQEDSDAVYQYIQLHYKIPQSKIIVMGRSMGSGPACHIASKNRPKALILISPFTSIRDVAAQHVPFFNIILKDQFQNSSIAHNITSPTCIIHGKSDTLISYDQAKDLYKSLGSQKKIHHFSKYMTHNDFDLYSDIIEPTESLLNCIKQAQEVEKQNDEDLDEQFHQSNGENVSNEQ